MNQFSHNQARQDVMSMVDAVLQAVDPYKIVHDFIQQHDDNKLSGSLFSDLDFDNGRLFIVSVGKAAIPMCQAALDYFGDKIYAGVGISKQPADSWPPSNNKFTFYQGNHPVPGEESILATTAVLDLLSQTRKDDLVLCLISGGTSALLTQPLINLAEWQQLNQALLASGCTINEFNTVRRQLDAIKGGGLALSAYPTALHSLILSDVVGSDLAAIGSGPTVYLDESPQDARAILTRYEIESALDTAVYQHIIQALSARNRLKPHANVTNIIIGDVAIAAKAAKKQAETSGFQTKLITAHLEGEAREAGKFAAAIAKDLSDNECALLGGETTVTLKGNGQGGRNLEVALAAGIALETCPHTAVATFATDGDDGQTGVAGAIVTQETVGYGRELNMDAQQYLNNNDSYTYFKTLDDAGYGPHLIITGQTGSNVNDLIFIIHYPMNGTP